MQYTDYSRSEKTEKINLFRECISKLTNQSKEQYNQIEFKKKYFLCADGKHHLIFF